MKHALFLSLMGILTAVLLSLLLPQPHKQQKQPNLSADAHHSITVLTESGTETTDLASYLPGVVAGEMPALFESEALKAQAVAARTYIFYRTQHRSAAHPEADICNNALCCKAYCSEETLRKNWGSHYDSYFQKLQDAVAATDGLYLTFDGEPIEAVFHSSSAGATEDSSAVWNSRPYLISVQSPETAADVPNYITENTFTPEQLQNSLSKAFPEMVFSAEPADWLSHMELTDSGRVRSLCVCGTRLSGTQLRSALGLRSSSFTAAYANGQFTFTVTGYGHGVGLSQYGANVFAKQGRSFREILAHYYPNTQLTSAAG